MFESRTCHLAKITVLLCIGVDRLGLAEMLQLHGADVVVSGMTELGGRR
jgi:hypothetical protein